MKKRLFAALMCLALMLSVSGAVTPPVSAADTQITIRLGDTGYPTESSGVGWTYTANSSGTGNLIIKEGYCLTGFILSGKLPYCAATVDNFGTIHGGMFNNAVRNTGVIASGAFFNVVYNQGTITGGNFMSSVNNDASITGGKFIAQPTGNGSFGGSASLLPAPRTITTDGYGGRASVSHTDTAYREYLTQTGKGFEGLRYTVAKSSGLIGLYLLRAGDPAPESPYSIQSDFSDGALGLNYEFTMPSCDATVYAVFDCETLTLETPAGLSWLEPRTATWQPVENASGYSVQLYKAGIAVGEPVSTKNTTLDLSQAISAAGYGVYTFRVTATGSHWSSPVYNDSAQSGASSILTVKFVPVTAVTPTFDSIIILDTEKGYSELTLGGTVTPLDATSQSIVWSIVNASLTHATLTGNTLRVTAKGTATVRATVKNGSSTGDYKREFYIYVRVPSASLAEVDDGELCASVLNSAGLNAGDLLLTLRYDANGKLLGAVNHRLADITDRDGSGNPCVSLAIDGAETVKALLLRGDSHYPVSEAALWTAET